MEKRKKESEEEESLRRDSWATSATSPEKRWTRPMMRPAASAIPPVARVPSTCVRTDGSPIDRLMFWSAAVKLVLTRSATLRRENFSTDSFQLKFSIGL